ncbi:MAG TPA: chorismate mutase [Gammaproteobacteria bacterium]|jgi:chorismate mutase|uniref:chorismate mutase n=1 Tax=OM182 bacterium TaxID=2510334 RepID=A0A520S587_9GAMM|nr:chorismate mutase [Gammaproteobacteria bacterium]RPG43869.1 MAG: chorismate mutase [Gammaproteobacteria bacterium TMED163]RZO77621.1 MAG: chorismate mutase [OM182 bacterium]RPG46106.1 MAG: chorismate mutase [Gammaproteobacteria bacterium TMED163]HAO89527.1 chorismate mutase [Gammaproteobacteria bacterium]|tara:strand:+ start:797 stop:1093 length:297 start_codon:yes stop_codon:yes gene_type:complete
MSDNAIPAELLSVREKIDAIDERLLDLLAERFQLTHQVGLLKANQQLSALDATREAEKLARLADLSSDRDLNPELIQELFRRIMQQVVQNHERLKVQG